MATAFIITTIPVLSGVMIAVLTTSVGAVYQTPDRLSRRSGSIGRARPESVSDCYAARSPK